MTVLCLLPGVCSTLQWTDARDSVLFQHQRRPGTRSFIRSTAKQNDVLITRNLMMSCGQVFGRNSQRSGDGVYIVGEVASNIYDCEVRTCTQHGPQFFRRNAGDVDAVYESPPLKNFPKNPRCERTKNDKKNS